MITCLSPAENNFEESLNALKYANRAKNIKNKSRINRDHNSCLVIKLQEEMLRMKELLNNKNNINDDDKILKYENKIKKLENRNNSLYEELTINIQMKQNLIDKQEKDEKE